MQQRPQWLSDADVSNCLKCREPFTLLRRKHHCRYCGQIFCACCSNYNMPVVAMDYLQPVRVCFFCFSLLDNHPDETSSGGNGTTCGGEDSDVTALSGRPGDKPLKSVKEAVLAGDLEAVKHYLSEEGRSVDRRNLTGQSLLHLAAFTGQLSIGQYLVQVGAEVDAVDEKGNTPLHYAAMFCHTRMVSFLHSEGADVNAKNRKSHTPLHQAIKQQNQRNTEIIQLLVSLGADVNAQTSKLRTPLHMACDYIGLDDTLVRYLLEQNCDKELRNFEGATPLHIAASTGNTKIVECLIENGCSVNVHDNAGNNPLHSVCTARGDQAVLLAHEKRILDTVDFLVQSGALSDTKNHEGKTPIEVCANEGIRTALAAAICSVQEPLNNKSPNVSGNEAAANVDADQAVLVDDIGS